MLSTLQRLGKCENSYGTLKIFLALSLVNVVLALLELLLLYLVPNFNAYNNHYMAIFYFIYRVCFSIFAMSQLELGLQLAAEGGESLYPKVKLPLTIILAVLIFSAMGVMNFLDYGMWNTAEYNVRFCDVFEGIGTALSLLLLIIISVGLYNVYRSIETFSNKKL